MFNREAFHWLMYWHIFQHLRFTLIDCVNNIEDINKERNDGLLLKKENLWIGTLCAIHKDVNDYHDWRRIRRNQKCNMNDW